MIALTVSVAAITNQGLRRSHNEDTIVVGAWRGSGSMTMPYKLVHKLEQPLLILVADGMGGHAAGEDASRIAAQHTADHILEADGESAIGECIRSANRAIYQAMAQSPERQGMGTTLAGILLRSNGHVHFNIGDSRVYRYKGGFLRQLSVDDVRERLDKTETARGSAVLTQCLGGGSALSDINPHVGAEPMVAGWRYILCSDGLTDMVPLEKIETLISEDDGEAVESLMRAALAAGGEDNISIIVATVGALE
jgi:serine/threonine protein phosphatase PrpC